MNKTMPLVMPAMDSKEDDKHKILGGSLANKHDGMGAAGGISTMTERADPENSDMEIGDDFELER